jgi:hypothetical protein
VIRANQPTVARHAEEIEIDAAAEIGMLYMRGVRVGETVQLAIPHRGSVENQIENLMRCTCGQSRYGQTQLAKPGVERNIFTPEKWSFVIENLTSGDSGARSRGGRSAQIPSQR